jgi:hypothetical protein
VAQVVREPPQQVLGPEFNPSAAKGKKEKKIEKFFFLIGCWRLN